MKASNGDAAVLAAGDGDFLPTIASLHARRLQVRVVSWSHTVGRRLRDADNEFIEADLVRARGLRARIRAPEEMAHHDRHVRQAPDLGVLLRELADPCQLGCDSAGPGAVTLSEPCA